MIKDCSGFTSVQNIEYYYSLINNIQYFNVFIFNYEKKQDVIDFFELFKPKDLGLTKDCFPFFVINENTFSKLEVKKFINDYNKSEEDDYKIEFGNFLFFNEVNKDFEYNILNIYNCYMQESKKLDNDSKGTINILLIGIKNSGKSFLVNKFLGETRALSMENHYTTKLNSYKHKLYPIVFYDISGFNQNEDNEIKDLNSKIDEFNKDYKNIHKKIHAIFYVIDCNNNRILQNKEKEIIEEIFKINIPIFILGTKAKKTNKQNFIRRTKLELDTFPDKYQEKIKILKDRIFCLDHSKESYLSLLKSVYEEFLISKNINNNIIIEYSNLKNEELINKSFSEDFSINASNNDEEKSKILKIYDYIKESIFFNDITLKIKEVDNNIKAIKEKYLNDIYYFKNLDTKSLSEDIENEFRKIFSQKDLEKIDKLIKEQQQNLIEKEKDIGGFKLIISSPIGSITSLSSIFCSLYFGPLPLLILICGCGYSFYKRNSETKSIIEENIDNLGDKFEWKYILLNINIIEEQAKIYNEVIDEFGKYINDFQTNDLN